MAITELGGSGLGSRLASRVEKFLAGFGVFMVSVDNTKENTGLNHQGYSFRKLIIKACKLQQTCSFKSTNVFVVFVEVGLAILEIASK